MESVLLPCPENSVSWSSNLREQEAFLSDGFLAKHAEIWTTIQTLSEVAVLSIAIW
jgi:hypothetical protein